MKKGFLLRMVCFIFSFMIILGSSIVCTCGSISDTEYTESQKNGIVSVSASINNTVVLREDGTVWGWGDNSSGLLGTGAEKEGKIVFEPIKIEGLEDVASISLGNGYLLALKYDGTVWGLGLNSNGVIDTGKEGKIIRKPVQIKNLSDIKSISAGVNYAMALHADGSVYIWGNYRYKASEKSLHLPEKIKYVKDADRIIASKYNAFFIDSKGKAWFCRGYLNKPVEIKNLTDIIHITESNNMTYAIAKDGSLWYWSVNGQYVQKMNGPENIKQVITGGIDKAAALDAEGNVWEWNEKEILPKRMECIDNVREISAGSAHMAAVKKDGTLWTWGDNSCGQLGNGGGFFEKYPRTVDGLNNVVKVSASDTFTAALKEDGTVWTWGSNKYGQLGDSTLEESFSPVRVKGIEGITDIAAGASHILALKNDGTVWAWGSNDSGELGTGDFGKKNAPVQVKGLGRVVAVSAGKDFSVALTEYGRVWVWGSSSYKPEKDKKDRNISIPIRVDELSGIGYIEAGDECVLAVSRAGGLWGWGNNFNGHLGYKPKEDNYIREKPRAIGSSSYITEIAAGSAHVLALSSDNKVIAWGSNEMGQLGADGVSRFYSPREIKGLSDIVDVESGGNSCYAKDSEGNIFVWGDNTYCQLGADMDSLVREPVMAKFLKGFRQISAGEKYTIAVKNDGTVVAWGDNTYGQLGIGRKSSSYFGEPVLITLP